MRPARQAVPRVSSGTLNLQLDHSARLQIDVFLTYLRNACVNYVWAAIRIINVLSERGHRPMFVVPRIGL